MNHYDTVIMAERLMMTQYRGPNIRKYLIIILFSFQIEILKLPLPSSDF
jgi:hypothetical protein